MLEARIRFYDIKKCGYYLRAQKTPLFGGVNDTLVNLSSWANDGRTLINTTTYEPNSDKDIYNTYFCDWFKPNGGNDSILILWNEVPNDKGVIYGMNPTASPGNRSMQKTDFGDEPAIPGFPSYFWFIPEHKVFATVLFNHSISGKGNLDHYIKGFLANKSPYRVFDSDNKVIGYSRNGKPDGYSEHINAYFATLGRKNDELEQELLQNRHKIRRFIKRETLQYTSHDGRSIVEKIFSKLLNNTPVFDNQARTISHELHFEPTASQIKQIISSYTGREGLSSLKDVGFVYNDQTRVMLSGINVTAATDLKVTRQEDHIIRPQTLLAALTKQRESLLLPLQKSPLEEEVEA